MSLRFYLYVSDAKVDMLLPQLDSSVGMSHTTEIGADLKVFNIKRSTASSPDEDRFQRVERVADLLEESGVVGTLEAPGPFVRGRMLMRWGLLDCADEAPLVYFAGRAGRTVVGLGGSAAHVLGSSADAGSGVALSRSLLPSLLDGLRRNPDIAPVFDEGEARSLDHAGRTALSAARHAAEEIPGPPQRIEFVARRLLYGPAPGTDGGNFVLLGSPLYAAYVD